MIIRCTNPFCRDAGPNKPGRYLGEVIGEEAHIPCPKCGVTSHWKAATNAPVAGPRMSVVGSRH